MKEIINYIHEIGALSRVQNSGWWNIGESGNHPISSHVFRSSAIAFLLGHLEKANPEKSACMALFHDMHEARLTDLNKVAQKYVDLREADIQVMQDQTFSLPKQIQKDILELHHNYANDGSKEGIISRDADLLEHGFKARELMVLGNSAAKDWIDNVNKLVKTDTAKTIAKSLYTSDPNEWLKGLKNIKR